MQVQFATLNLRKAGPRQKLFESFVIVGIFMLGALSKVVVEVMHFRVVMGRMPIFPHKLEVTMIFFDVRGDRPFRIRNANPKLPPGNQHAE